jgi:hypothetical protein
MRLILPVIEGPPDDKTKNASDLNKEIEICSFSLYNIF